MRNRSSVDWAARRSSNWGRQWRGWPTWHPWRSPWTDISPLYAALADLNRRAGHAGEAADTYRRAIAASEHDAERRFLARRLADLPG